jgi:hypothetical protein
MTAEQPAGRYRPNRRHWTRGSTVGITRALLRFRVTLLRMDANGSSESGVPGHRKGPRTADPGHCGDENADDDLQSLFRVNEIALRSPWRTGAYSLFLVAALLLILAGCRQAGTGATPMPQEPESASEETTVVPPSLESTTGATTAPPETVDPYERLFTAEDLLVKKQPEVYAVLIADGFKPRNDLDAWPVVVPVEWDADPFGDENWRFQLHSWRFVDPYLTEYERTADPQVLLDAFVLMGDWYRFHVVGGNERNKASEDMATGLRASRLAYLVDTYLAGDLPLSDADAGVLWGLVDTHARELQEPEFLSGGNHGLFQLFGLYTLCRTASAHPSCAGAADYAVQEFEALVASQYTDEGVHRENSPGYHIWLTGLIGKMGRLLAAESDDLRQLLERAGAVSPWLVFPDRTVAQAGDTSSTAALVIGMDREPVCLTDGCFAVADYSQSGYVVIRSLPDDPVQSMLFVTGMAHTRTHKHADELSFQLFESGRFLFVDPGKYGYQPGVEREYVRSATAHNTISLETTGIGRDDIEFSGSLLDPIVVTDDGFIISGEVARPGILTQGRVITYDPGSELTVADTVTILADERIVSSLHLAPDLEPVLTGDGFLVPEILEAKVSGTRCELEAVRGETDSMLGWYSPAYLELVPITVVRAICDPDPITWVVNLGG